MAKYKDPVQNAAAIRVGQEGADGIDLSKKVVVVTGANSGIGKALATYAAAKGAKLYMFCRSKERAEEAKNEISEITSNENIDVILIDLVCLHRQLQVETIAVFSFVLCMPLMDLTYSTYILVCVLTNIL